MLWKRKKAESAPREIKAKAQKLAIQGRLEKAIRAYDELLQQRPDNIIAIHRKADLQMRLGRRKQALATYFRAASGYSRQGHHLKAVALFKRILRHDAERPDVHLKLADEYEALGLAREAICCLRSVAVRYEQQGRREALRELLLRIFELGQDRVAHPIELGDLYLRAGMRDEALTYFEKLARRLRQEGCIEDCVKVLHRLAALDPQDAFAAKELGSICLERGDHRRALEYLERAHATDPADAEALSMIFHASNELDPTGLPVAC